MQVIADQQASAPQSPIAEKSYPISLIDVATCQDSSMYFGKLEKVESRRNYNSEHDFHSDLRREDYVQSSGLGSVAA